MLLARAGHDVRAGRPRRGCPATPTRPTPSSAAASSSWPAGGCWTRCVASGRPPIRSVLLPPVTAADRRRRAVKDRAGVDFLLAPRRARPRRGARRAPRSAPAPRCWTGTTVDRRPACTGRPGRRRRRRDAGRDAARGHGPAGRRRRRRAARRMAGSSGAEVVESARAERRLPSTPTSASVPGTASSSTSADRRLRRRVPDPPRRGLRVADPARPPRSARAPRPARTGSRPGWTRSTRALPDLGRAGPGGPGRHAPLRGAVGLPNHVRRAAGPGWALVGDAGYHRDPITGHGMTDAFRDAELLAEAADRALRDRASEAGAMAALRARARHGARATRSRLTRALGAFPPPSAFVELRASSAGRSTPRRRSSPRAGAAGAADPPPDAQPPTRPPQPPHTTPPQKERTTMSITPGAPPQRRRHRHPVRHHRRGARAAGGRAVPVPRRQRVGQRHPQPRPLPRLLRGRPGARPRAADDGRRRPTTRPCSSAQDHGPTPAELLLNALALLPDGRTRQHRRRPRHRAATASAARVEGDIDLRGILGIDADGAQRLRGHPRRRSTSTATPTPSSSPRWSPSRRHRSAVFDVLTHGTTVTVDVARG